MELRRVLGRLAAGSAAGLLICAALPPWGWWPLAPVGIAWWLHLLATASRRSRFALSWAVGVGWFGPSTLWMWGLTPPGYVVALLAGWGPLVGLIGLATPADRRRLVVVPAAVVLFEWFHSHAPFGGVPLSMLAMTQARGPLLPIARLGGALLVGAAVAALGAALHLAVRDRAWRTALPAVAAVAAIALLGALWPAGGDGASVRVAAIQGGGPQGTRFRSSDGPVVFQRHLDLTRELSPSDGLDVVLWPENAVNVDGAFEDSGWGELLSAEAVRLGASIVVGIVEDDPDDPDAFLNYVVVYEPDGSVRSRYDKVRRVPFGEYVPLRPLFEPLAGGALPPRDQTPGEDVAVIRTGSGPMAVAISWEVFFSRRVREGVREGGEIVLNPTNGSSYWLTLVQTQQIATSALRAVESGRWVVQAAPTGFSAFLDDRGSLQRRSGVSERTVLVDDVPRRTGTTPAQALGDLPAVAAAALALALALVGPARRRRSDRSQSQPDHAA